MRRRARPTPRQRKRRAPPLREIEAKLAEKQAALRQAFPDYAELANPKPLPLADAQALLGEGDALVLFLDLWQMGKVPEETIVFALTKKEARWTSIRPGHRALRERVTALRCGLDTGAGAPADKNAGNLQGAEPGTIEVAEVSPRPCPSMPLPRHALYRDLFGGIEDLIKGKRLLIVPSGALTQLPFEVLVTAKPDETLPRFEAYKKAAWLGQRQAITILPSVGSLKALRAAKASAAPEPFAGFGNPLLTGAGRHGQKRLGQAGVQQARAAEAERTLPASPRASPRCSGAARSMSRICAVSRRCPRRRTSFARVGRELGVPEAGSTRRSISASRRRSPK